MKTETRTPGTPGALSLNAGNGKLCANGVHVATMRATCVTQQWLDDAYYLVESWNKYQRQAELFAEMKTETQPDKFMEWVRDTNLVFSQSGGKINLNEHEVRKLFNSLQRQAELFAEMEKALRGLVDKNLTYFGTPEEVSGGIFASDVQFARAVLLAVDAEKAKDDDQKTD